MKSSMRLFAIAILVVLLCQPGGKTSAQTPVAINGSVYYVDQAHPAASDNNPGTEELPWKTIQRAANVVVAGDTVYVRSGTYEERITFANSGSPGQRITFQALPRRSVTMYGFYTLGTDYLTISGFNITTASWLTGWTDQNGVFIRSNDVEVVDNYFYDFKSAAVTGYWHAPYPQRAHLADNRIFRSQMGIVITGYDWLVEGNEVERLVNSGSGDSDYSRFFGDNHIIRQNYFHGSLVSEIGAAHVDCFQTFDNNGEFGHNITFDGNWCSEFHQGLMAEAHFYHNISHLTFKNNVFAHGWAWGLCVQDIPYLTAVNNTFIDITHHGIGLSGDSHHGVVKNNIFYDTGTSYWFEDTSSIDGDYNLIDNAQTPPVRGLHDQVGVDPLFVNPATDDFHLQANSPAVDAGLGMSMVDLDFDRLYRPRLRGWDIGAFEYQPLLVLQAISADGALHLTWEVGDSFLLPPTATWQISYTPSPSVPPQITGIANGVRNYHLTGLTNYILYTVTLTAVDGATPLRSVTIQGMPSGLRTFLPTVAK